jgi:hypothetical protein
MEHAENWDMEDVLVDYIRGNTQLTVFFCDGEPFGAFISGIERYPKKTVLHVYAVSVKPMPFDWFPETWARVRDLAKSVGCDSIVGSGRSGWLRKIPGAEPLNSWEAKV